MARGYKYKYGDEVAVGDVIEGHRITNIRPYKGDWRIAEAPESPWDAKAKPWTITLIPAQRYVVSE